MSKEQLFMRAGIAFMIFVPLAFVLTDVHKRDETKAQQRCHIEAIVAEINWHDGERFAPSLRRLLLNTSETNRFRIVRKLSPDELRALFMHLDMAPTAYRYDGELIRLKAFVKNQLDALDLLESGCIMEMWPEVKQDKEA